MGSVGMLFAKSTSEQNLQARKCKELVRMPNFRRFAAADRKLASWLFPATQPFVLRPQSRSSSEVKHGLPSRALALAVLGFSVAGVLPAAAQAKALSSASLEIQSLVWYRALGATPSVSDPIVATRFLNPPPPNQPQQETVLRGGTEFFQFSGSLDDRPYFGFSDRFISTSGGLAPLTAGPECEGAGCPGASDFDPLTPPPTSDFVQNYGAVDGYFSSTPNNPSIPTGLSQGVRSDVSLESAGSTGSSDGLWDSSTILNSNQSFNTYFVVEFAAQALAYAEGVGDSAGAEVSLSLSVSGGDNAVSVSWPILALSSFSGESEYDKRRAGALNSYTSLGNFIELVPTTSPFTSYNVRIVAETSVSAETSDVPLPSVAWLLGAGLIPLAAVRAGRSFRRTTLQQG